MDSYRTIIGRLRFALVLLFILVACLQPVFATVTCPAGSGGPGAAQYLTSDEAMAACKAEAAKTIYGGKYTCSIPSGMHFVDGHFNGGDTDYSFCSLSPPPPPPNPCTTNAPALGSGLLAGKYLQGYSFCTAVPDGSGGTVMCKMSVTVSGPPTMNPYGSWHTPGGSTATGDLCDGSGGSGANNFKNADGTPAADPVPPPPESNPPQNPMPKACDGGSCYDAANDQYCAVSGSGTQFCVSGGAARGDKGGAQAGQSSGQPAGACASSGDSTICAGSPSAPLPPSSVVPDPPAAIRSNDTYTQANPQTGANESVVVNTYTNPGAPAPSSGQQTGDLGPAPASSTGTSTDKGSASGGADCNSPPVCSGDAVNCAVLMQSWRTRCAVEGVSKALNGTGTPPASGQHTESEVDSGVIDLGDTSTLDQTGFGFGTACPFQVVTIHIGDYPADIPMDKICEYGSWMRAFVLMLAALKCADILGRK